MKHHKFFWGDMFKIPQINHPAKPVATHEQLVFPQFIFGQTNGLRQLDAFIIPGYLVS
jgi:hypothetical protein